MTASAAIFLLAIAGVYIRYGKAKRFVSYLLVLAGVGLALVVAGYLGALASFSIYGAGALSVAAVILGLVWYFEGHRGEKHHEIRTPIVSFLFGVTLMLAGGSGFAAVQGVVHGVGSAVGHGVDTSFNGKGK